jgi:hypothetical protein
MPLQHGGGHPLHRPDSATMDHQGPMLTAVSSSVGQIEPFGLVEVELHGGDALLVAAAVGHLDIQLGPVERGLTGRLDEPQPGRPDDVLRGRPQLVRSGLPLLG